MKESSNNPEDHLNKGQLMNLNHYTDGNGIVRVDKVLTSYETRYPALLPHKHSISHLITRHKHQCGHIGIVVAAARIRRTSWILKADVLAKTIKCHHVLCRKIEAKVESQIIADLPKACSKPFTPSLYITSVNYLGPTMTTSSVVSCLHV